MVEYLLIQYEVSKVCQRHFLLPPRWLQLRLCLCLHRGACLSESLREASWVSASRHARLDTRATQTLEDQRTHLHTHTCVYKHLHIYTGPHKQLDKQNLI